MTLKILELISILLSALVAGVFWGPWLSLSRSNAMFKPDVFLAIAHRMTQNLASVMRILMPAAMLSMLAVLFLSYRGGGKTFYLTLAGFVLFLVALLVTVIVEVPIVKQITTWTVTTLPRDWQQLRDRWGAFHVIRVVASLAGLTFLVMAAIF
jgi:uncharacterized membrane protein